MTNSDRLSADEPDKSNQELRAEILECKHLKDELIELRDKLEVEVRDTNIVHRLSMQYIEGKDLFSILQETVEAAIAITRADKGNIQILDPSTGKLKLAAQKGFGLPFLKFFELVDTEEAAACGTAMKRMERVVIEDVTRSPIFLGSDALNVLLDEGVRAVQSTPLVSWSGQFIGIISTHFNQIHTPSERELKLIDILGRQAADIIENKKTEEILQESEKRYRTLFTNITEGFYLAEIICDKDGKPYDYRYLEINPAYELITGIRKDQILGKSFLEVFPGSNPAEIEKYGEVALSGKSANFEVFYQKEGKYFDIYLFSPEKGKFAAILKDITQSKKAEGSLHEAYEELQSQSEKLQAFNEELQIQSEKLLVQTEELQKTYDALQKSEERYRTLFTNMTEGFVLAEVIYDKSGKPYDYRYLEINPVYERSTGLKREQVLGKSILEILPNVNPILIEKLGETALSGKPEHFEIFSQVTSKYFDTYVFSPDKERVAATFRDITARKQAEEALRESEEKYRTIVETASEGIWVGDPESRTIYINKRMTEMLGYTQDEIIGKFIWDFVGEEDKPIIKKYIEKRRQGIDERYEFKFTRKDGSPLWTIVSSRSLFDKAGKFTGSMIMLTDINDRKKAEAKLRETLDNLESLVKERTAELEKAYNSLKESKESLAEAQRLAHLGNWDLNIVTGKMYWSHEMYLIFGRDLREQSPPYDEFLNYVHPEDREYVSNALNDALSGKFYSTDYRIIRTNGEERIVNMQSEVTFDEKNTPVRMRGIVQDITERKRIEKELQESESRFRNLFEVISSGVIIYDVIDDGRDFIFKDINPAGEQIDHVRRKDIVGKSLYEFFPNVSDMGLDAAFRRVWLTGKPESLPMTYYKDQNIALWVTNYIYKLPSGELVAVFEDITERKQAEEERERLLSAIQQEKDRLAALINSITDEVWFADTRKHFTLINPPAYSEFYIRSGKEIEVEKFLENVKVYRPDGSLRPINESPSLRALQGEVVKNKEEIVCTPVHGELRYRQVSAAPVRDTGGNIIGSVSVARDITEQKKAEEALAKIEIARKKEIHHRIKNNLQVISSLLDLQAEKFNNRECIRDSEVLSAFRESQDRVMSIALIHEELHEGGGDNELNFSVYLEKLVENLFQTYRIGNAGISLKIDLEENLFFDVDTAVPLGMIVNELVSNSFKHAFPGRDKKGTIQIKLSSEKSQDEQSNKDQLSEDGNEYTVMVSDNGDGIPDSVDLENPDTLGLQLVAILVDQLGGEIEIRRDKGTEFRIRINVKQT